MKKVAMSVTVILMILSCLCVWPFCLVRKDAVYWTTTPYIDNDLYQNDKAIMRQTFVAQESFISEIAFAISFAGGDCEVSFRLYDSSGETLAMQSAIIPEDDSSRFCYVSIDKWIKKGHYYTFEVEIMNPEKVNPQFLCTQNDESTTLGNLELYINGEYFDGQAVTSYQYREPLNYKNVMFIWTAVFIIGFSFIGILNTAGESSKEKKLGEALDKYGNILLIVEILAITVLLVRCCFTKAVDWDEAYTWDIVTRNSLWGVVIAQASDNHPPLYFLLTKLATLVFGDRMIVFKAVSVSGALASMALSATIVRKRWGTRTAILLTLILGLGPQFVYYNINLRMYSWMAFFVFAASVMAYEIILSNQRKRNWVLFALATLGALYTQYFSVVPLFIIYGYLLVVCIGEKRLKQFIVCCLSVIVAYLPQLYLVIAMLRRDSTAVNDGMKATLNLSQLCQWSFGTNIRWSESIPVVLYIFGILLLLFSWRRMPKMEKYFIALTAGVYPLTCLVCYAISANMNHFWDNRYMLDALLFLWLFIAIVYARQGVAVWLFSCICFGITSLSAYGILCTQELSTIDYIDDAIEKLKVVQDEEIILYNYPTFDVMYRYYIPDADFVWFDEADFSKLDGEYVYMIRWGGQFFSEEVMDKYDIVVEPVNWFRLEQGVDNVLLCKVYFDN